MHIRGHLYLSTDWICMDNLGTRIPMFNSRNHLHLIQALVSKTFPNLSLGKLNFFPAVTVVLKLLKIISKSTKFTKSTRLSCQISIKRHYLKRGGFFRWRKKWTLLSCRYLETWVSQQIIVLTVHKTEFCSMTGYIGEICKWSEQGSNGRARICFSYWHIPSYPPVL